MVSVHLPHLWGFYQGAAFPWWHLFFYFFLHKHSDWADVDGNDDPEGQPHLLGQVLPGVRDAPMGRFHAPQPVRVQPELRDRAPKTVLLRRSQRS